MKSQQVKSSNEIKKQIESKPQTIQKMARNEKEKESQRKQDK